MDDSPYAPWLNRFQGTSVPPGHIGDPSRGRQPLGEMVSEAAKGLPFDREPAVYRQTLHALAPDSLKHD